MADILSFPTEARPPRSAGEPATKTKALTPSRKKRAPGAEIVIFPGVRIERWSECPPTAAPSRADIPRDRLEI